MALARAQGGHTGLGAQAHAATVVISRAPHGVHLEASAAQGHSSMEGGSAAREAEARAKRATIAKI